MTLGPQQFEGQRPVARIAKKVHQSRVVANTKANGLKNAHFSKISVSGVICAIKIRETALYS